MYIKKTDSERYIENNSFTIDGTETSIIIFIQINPDFSVNDIIYPMLNLGNTAKPFEPYTDGKPSPSPDYPQGIISKEVSEIKVTGKNLANIQEFEAIGSSGFEAQYEDDKIVYSGANTWAGCAVVLPQTFEAGQYTIKAKNVAMLVSDVKIVGFSDVVYWENLGYPYWMKNFYSKTEGYTFYSDKPFKIGFIGGTKTDGTTDAEGTMEQIQIELSSEATSYEQHKEQIITLSEPITLYSVPVSKDGNITIDSQMYKSDLICEKGGVYGVERNCYFREFKVAEMNNSEEFAGWKNVEDIFIFAEKDYNAIFNGEYMTNINNSNNLFLINTMTATNNKIVVLSKVLFEGTQSQIKEQYQDLIIRSIFTRLESTFEPLPDIDQQAIKALKTYFPTTVLNTGAFNKINYLADTKTWIENKLNGVTELALGIGGK